jgi:alkylation response protein AidB-like acyl-CoA dehydrogenase
MPPRLEHGLAGHPARPRLGGAGLAGGVRRLRLDAAQRYIFASELAAADAPPLSPMGIGMCGPVLIGHGTAEQKAHYLPRMLTGEHVWCQGYSEPGSGSDLASLQMSAVEDGDDLVCNGHKLWTTHANVANWIFCLVRTSQEAIRQQGITFLLIDMATPGVSVSPIIMLSGEHIRTTSSSPT